MLHREPELAPRPGTIVAWWDRSTLALGLVVAEEKGRLRLVRARGGDEHVKPSRVVAVVSADAEPPGDDPASRRRARSRVAQADERVRQTAATVEVPLVWDIVRENRGDAARAALTVDELAELALDSTSGLARAATVLALVEDGLHFVRKGDGWDVRDAAAVSALRVERAQEARRESETREFLAGLAVAVERGALEERGTDAERRYLAALERLAVEGDAAGEPMRGPALEALAASGLSWSRPAEGAFRVLRRLGRFASDDENLQVRRFGLRTDFPAAVLEHAARRRAAGFDRAGRRDLTALDTVSIDSAHTREIDDLVSVESRPDGGARLGVHIADPSAFVDAGDPADSEALARGLTHYMPDLRLPMLPPLLSEDAASLVAGAERPALSFLVDVDPDGRLTAFEIVPSIVRSRRRLSYDEAERLIDAGDEALVRLAALAARRQEARARDGAVVFQTPEVDVHVDAAGRPVLERISADSRARLVVSEAMVLAGDVAARFCSAAGLPVAYRRQAPPSELPALPPDGLSDPVAARWLRRRMRRAETTLEPGPHAGLGLAAYVQATSPLRRFQDLVAHRQILSRLQGRPSCYDRAALLRILATTERAEADARSAEEAAKQFWRLRYLESFTGQTLEALVVETDPRPVVQLEESLREQPVPGLAGAEPGQRVRVEVVRVEPRAGILVLRPVG